MAGGIYMGDVMYWGDNDGVKADFYIIMQEDVLNIAEQMRDELGADFVDGLSDDDVAKITEEVGYGAEDIVAACIQQLASELPKAVSDKLVALKQAHEGA